MLVANATIQAAPQLRPSQAVAAFRCEEAVWPGPGPDPSPEFHRRRVLVRAWLHGRIRDAAHPAAAPSFRRLLFPLFQAAGAAGGLGEEVLDRPMTLRSSSVGHFSSAR